MRHHAFLLPHDWRTSTKRSILVLLVSLLAVLAPALAQGPTAQRESVVRLDVTAGRVARCTLPALVPGTEVEASLRLALDEGVDADALAARLASPEGAPRTSEGHVAGPAEMHDRTVHPDAGGLLVRAILRATPPSDDTASDPAVWQVAVPAGAHLRDAVLRGPGTETRTLDCTVDDAQGSALLVVHTPPVGASYLPGSTRVTLHPAGAGRSDGPVRAIEPVVLSDDALAWSLPYAAAATLTYAVRHEDPLAPLRPPDVTVRLDDRELRLLGNRGFDALEDARPATREALLLSPAPGTVFGPSERVVLDVLAEDGVTPELRINGVPYEGDVRFVRLGGRRAARFERVPLRVGANRVTVRASERHDELTLYRAGPPAGIEAMWDGGRGDLRTAPRVRVTVVDAAGLPTGRGTLTVASDVAVRTPDTDLRQAGHQLHLEGGEAMLELAPQPSATRVRLRFRFRPDDAPSDDEIRAETVLDLPGADRTLWIAQGQATARLVDPVELFGSVRGYLETPVAAGTLQAAVDVGADTTGLDLDRTLRREPDPDGRFPLTGTGREAVPALRSDDGVAVRYDDENVTVSYLAGALEVPGVERLPRASALRGEARLGAVELSGFAGLLPSETVQETIVPDGTRRYRLERRPQPGTETVQVVSDEGTRTLAPRLDYVLNASTGVLTLARPMLPTDPDLSEVRLEVTYAPNEVARDTVAGGLGVRYRDRSWSLEAGVAQTDVLRWGARAAYGGPLGPGDARLAIGARDDDVAGIGANLELGYVVGPLSLRGDATYQEARLRGSARAAVEVAGGSTVAAEHRAEDDAQRSSLLFEQRLPLAGEGRTATLGVGAGREWLDGTWDGLARGRLEVPGARLQLDHAQPLTGGRAATTGAQGRVALPGDVEANARLDYRWDEALDGSVQLERDLADATVSLAYELPGVDGAGNLARLGVDVPVPLDEHWALDGNVGLERDFDDGGTLAAFGGGVRYRTDALVADLASEVSVGSTTKWVARGGMSGQLTAHQVLSVYADYQLSPTRSGTATAAYAWRGGSTSLLTYHRLRDEPEKILLEGEAALTWHPNASLQVRPGVAYRVPFNEPEARTYQASLFVVGYRPLAGEREALRTVGLGVGGHALVLPAANALDAGISVEGQVEALDGLWLAVGYTFAGFEGLTPSSAGGIYLRIDAAASGQR
ncbi:MAG: hypothetical protein U5K81_09390 [Trueperaceae bacterium]|nr:hypothetical protein [Trueperaceae bacterium]